MKHHPIRAALLLLLGILSLVYYGICIAWAHIGVSWLWLWPGLSGFCFVRAGMLIAEYKRKRYFFPRWVRRTWAGLVAAGLLCFAAGEASIVSAMSLEAEPGLDVIIVLGAAVRGESPTSPMLLRMQRALEYLQENPETLCIASGGQGSGESISEAECIRRYLTENGISEDRILLEPDSKDTKENIRNSFRLMEDENASVGVVTSSFHVRRALLICEQQGHKDVRGIPAKALLPLGIHYTVREFFGIVQLLATGG